jgi:hypothetical protein
MGIDNSAAKLLVTARIENRINFNKSVVIGRQRNYISKNLARKLEKLFSIPESDFQNDYSEFLFKALGAETLSCLDISSYEGADVIQDLNIPISNDLVGKFSCVIDIGTSEHVMNAAQSISNLRNLCGVGGHVIMLNPANNWLGHGFYQFSPELFYRSFSDEFGFKIKQVFLIEKHIFGEKWFKLNDPKNEGRRVSITTKHPTYIGVIAEKISNSQIGSTNQSDYELAWQRNEVSKLGALYLRLPKTLRKITALLVIKNLDKHRNKLRKYKPQS